MCLVCVVCVLCSRAVVVKPEGVPTVGDGVPSGDGGWTAERMLPYYLQPTAGVVGPLYKLNPK